MKKNEHHQILKWLCYYLALFVMYAAMVNNPLSFASQNHGFLSSAGQPVIILPLCAAVAMFEKEVSSAIFGMFGGLLLDMAAGSLFGFNAALLMLCCMLVSLLSTNLVRTNIVNGVFFTAACALFAGFMDYIFNYRVWGNSAAGEGGLAVVMSRVIIPSYGGCIIASPLMYLPVSALHRRFKTKEIGDR